MSAQPQQFSELDGAIEQLQIAEKRARKAERDLHRLQKQIGTIPEDAPEAKAVRELLDLWWRRVKNSHAGVNHDLDRTGTPKVRATLARRTKLARKNGHANPEAYALLECKKAIVGITQDEWAMGRNPKSRGKSYNDIADHVLGDDAQVEKWAALFDDWCSSLTMEPLPKDEALSLQRARNRREQVQQRKQQHWEQRERENPETAVLAALTRGGWDWRCTPKGGWEAQCPAHQGTDRNLSIDWNADESALLLKCWSHGCETAYVMDALGLPLYVLFRDPKEKAA